MTDPGGHAKVNSVYLSEATYLPKRKGVLIGKISRTTFYLLGVLFIFGGGCGWSVSQIPVKGEFAGRQVETTVDSEVARYYLQDYLQNRNRNPNLHRIIDQAHRNEEQSPVTRGSLERLSKKFSPDFATLFLAKKILGDESNRRMQSAFDAEVSKEKSGQGKEAVQFSSKITSYVVLFAPGWFYKTDPENAGDFARPRQVLSEIGVETRLIPTDENGTVENNALFISQEILRLKGHQKNIILVSASKSGPEVAQALGELLDPSQTRHVKAWINIGGVLRGSPLADATLRWPKRWFVRLLFLWKGWDFSSVESMATKRSDKRFLEQRIPEHILVINYIGVPLSGQITERAQDGYGSLRDFGPNDGLTLLIDEIVPGSVSILEIGLDHYFRDPDTDLKMVAMARTVVNFLETIQRTHPPNPPQSSD
jgi:hypothetical protein